MFHLRGFTEQFHSLDKAATLTSAQRLSTSFFFASTLVLDLEMRRRRYRRAERGRGRESYYYCLRFARRPVARTRNHTGYEEREMIIDLSLWACQITGLARRGVTGEGAGRDTFVRRRRAAGLTPATVRARAYIYARRVK